jgi:Protein of unknown function (DUF4054)
MTYAIPTAADFKERFPRFASVSNTVLDAVISEASGQADTTWLERDYAPAIMYYAAHLLVMEGVDGAPGGGSGGGVGPVKSESIGDSSVSYGGAATTVASASTYSKDTLRSTSYGQMYLRLLRQNQPGILVI